jgi:glyoxylase-like metal-dependent hydrolase (beta-lactamase superfamily II)
VAILLLCAYAFGLPRRKSLPQTVQANQLHYPYKDLKLPKAGKVTEVADGVFWLRIPLPMVLNHINVWLLRDGDGWVLVDTGMRSEETRDLWQFLFTDIMEGRPLHKLFATHMHPDHMGLADWLCRQFDCALHMSQGEFYYAHYLGNVEPESYLERVESFYHRMGFIDGLDENNRREIAHTPKAFSGAPMYYRRLIDGQTLTIDGVRWQIVVGSGHSPEHCCLYCPDKKLLISGDQVLPTISSNISVYSEEPEGNPLEEWLSSCRRLQNLLPDDLLVLPAHGQPFYGLHLRLQQLLDEHEGQLNKLRTFYKDAGTCSDSLAQLFRKNLSGFNRLIAASEAQAHINYLLERSELTREMAGDGAYRYLAVNR